MAFQILSSLAESIRLAAKKQPPPPPPTTYYPATCSHPISKHVIAHELRHTACLLPPLRSHAKGSLAQTSLLCQIWRFIKLKQKAKIATLEKYTTVLCQKLRFSEVRSDRFESLQALDFLTRIAPP